MTKELTRKDFPILKDLEKEIVTICGYSIVQADELQRGLNKVLKSEYKFVSLDYDSDNESATYTLKSISTNKNGTTIFDNDQDTIDFWWNLGKYGIAEAIINSQTVALCGTCLVYEDEIWGHCNTVLKDHDENNQSHNELIADAATILSGLVYEYMLINPSDITQDERDSFAQILFERDEACRDGWDEDDWQEECLVHASSLFRDLTIQVFERVSGVRILNIYDSY